MGYEQIIRLPQVKKSFIILLMNGRDQFASPDHEFCFFHTKPSTKQTFYHFGGMENKLFIIKLLVKNYSVRLFFFTSKSQFIFFYQIWGRKLKKKTYVKDKY